MKIFFETFKKSIYNPSFYREVKEEPFSKTFRYYTKASFVLTVMMTVALSVLLIPQGISFIKERAPELVKTYYPKELVVHIEKGEASANVPMPYIIPIKQVTGTNPAPNALQNMVVIDTNHEFDKKTFVEQSTYFLLTKAEVVTQSDRGDITLQDLRGVPTLTISQETLLSFVDKVRTSLLSIVVSGVLVTFIILALGYLVYLIPLFVFALIPFFIAWIKKEHLSYLDAYKMSVYAIIPALALKTLINLAGVFFLPSYFTLLVFMLIMSLNMRDIEQQTLFKD